MLSFGKHLLNSRFICSKLSSVRCFSKHISVSEEVKHALECGDPIVTLESTIITHGMPYPENLKCAMSVEEIVRKGGAVPATVAIINGQIKVGLNNTEMEQLGDVGLTKPIKTSRRDLAFVVSNKHNGGTTVSGTLIVANKVGIPVFATGGIGGVHREGEKTFDISADLIELGKTNVAVVSSGVKSILDIAKTLEYLETQGVFVATYGNTCEFPAFYSQTSGFKAPYNVENARQAARIIQVSSDLNMGSGMLFAVPVPPQFNIDQMEIQSVIEKALCDAKSQGITGKAITPFLLGRVAEITKGKSLETNVALIKNNAKTAAEISVELARLNRNNEKDEQSASLLDSKKKKSCGVKNNEEATTPPPVIIGGSNLDCCVTLTENEILHDGRIHYCSFAHSSGGVARNMCEALGKLGVPPAFISAIGDDESGKIIKSTLSETSQENIVVLKDKGTAQCMIVLDPKGDCPFLLGDMSIHQMITPEVIRKNEALIKKTPLIVIDANLTKEAMECIFEIGLENKIPVFFEPTDVLISSKPFETKNWAAVKYVTPNLTELKHMSTIFNISSEDKKFDNPIDEAVYISKELSAFIDNVIVTLGPKGVVITRKGSASDKLLNFETKGQVESRYYPVDVLENVVNVSGAGDCLASGIIAGMLRLLSEEQCVSVGFKAAKTALESKSAVAKVLFDKNDKSWSTKARYIVK